ncbi:MAG TPA: hypothetical protein VFN68_06845 [Acidimicrobiales bacterium]|nr:hypothetical protein [Acidimicrobiales bacterium]
MHDLTCAEVLDAAPPFALDILEPSRRSLVAAHLIRCPECRDTVTGMQASAAALLDLDGADWSRPCEARPVPDGPPAAGLRPGRRRVRLVMTVAAATLLVVGSAFGSGMGGTGRHSPTPVTRAPLLEGGRTVGYVNFYSGRSPALDLQVAGVAAHGSVTCETVGLDGTVTRLGSFGLYQGHGYWATTTPVDPSGVSSVVLVDGQGRTLASTTPAAVS